MPWGRRASRFSSVFMFGLQRTVVAGILSVVFVLEVVVQILERSFDLKFLVCAPVLGSDHIIFLYDLNQTLVDLPSPSFRLTTDTEVRAPPPAS
jgi:hypothetical protein